MPWPGNRSKELLVPSVICGDCVEQMALMPEASVDAVVTDPPYGLEFMGKEWDAPWKSGFAAYGMDGERRAGPVYGSKRNPVCLACHKHKRGTHRCVCPAPQFDEDAATHGRAQQAWHHRWATEALRVLKPGGHLVAFGGTRTYHRMVCAVEDAGFEIRDTLMWLYGQGFPKSHDVSKAIDKTAGAERRVIGVTNRVIGPAQKRGYQGTATFRESPNNPGNLLTAPATEAAICWQGWGTALKPACEPIVLARKPLVGTVAANVGKFGVGALNVDGCRIPGKVQAGAGSVASFRGAPDTYKKGTGRSYQFTGRWPANVLLDEGAATILDEQSGERPSRGGAGFTGTRIYGWATSHPIGSISPEPQRELGFGDSGGASRFFYCAKASSKERNEGLNGERSNHPTVKPLALMRWLCRLVTPPGGLILDPFAGSGSTLIAAHQEGFQAVGVEQDEGYCRIAEARLAWWCAQPAQEVLI